MPADKQRIRTSLGDFSFTSRSINASAIGLRQTLPVQTKRTCFMNGL
jgi:hypothetical protein